MLRYRNWVLALGIAVLLPSATQAGLFDYFKSKKQSTKPTANQVNQNDVVARKIAKQLRDAQLKGYDIEIEFLDGDATLKGQVINASQKAKAEKVVQQVAGVKRVNNRLTIVSPKRRVVRKRQLQTIQQVAATEPAPFPAPFPAPVASPPAAPPVLQSPTFEPPKSGSNNQQIAENIAGALSSAGLSKYNMEVRFRNGTATLNGEVASPDQKRQASDVVADVSGVRMVENNLMVSGGRGLPPQQQVAYRPQALGYPARGMYPQQQGAYPPQLRPAAYQPAGPGAPPQGLPPGMPSQRMGMPPAGMPIPQGMGHPGAGAPHTQYNQPNLPKSAWPGYAAYPNYAAVSYPKQHSASAWPYIGPFYPYPQVPLGWRQVQLEWDDGNWNLNFRPRTDKWWWFLQPKNW